MSGNCLQLQESDLSHLQNLFSAGIWHEDIITQRNPASFPRSFLLPWMLFVSLGIHAVLLSLSLSSTTELKSPVVPQTIHIELQSIQYNPPLSSAVVDSVLEEPVVETPKATHINVSEKEQNVLIDKVEKKSAFIPITPDELQSLQDQPTYSLEPSDADLGEVSSQPFGSVFDPRLRKKLQDQHLEKQAKALGISTYELANGSKVVKLSDNHCLSTLSQGKKENETNWYHTGCHEKTEGEQMMDRVNESLRLKRQ